MSRTPVSIRARLTRTLLLWLGGVLILGGAATYAFVRLTLSSQFDSALMAKAGAVAGGMKIESTPNGVRLDFDLAGEAMPEFQRARDPEYYEIWALAPAEDVAEPRVVERSATLAGADLGQPRASSFSSGTFDAVLPDGRPGRITWLQFVAHAEPEDSVEPAAIALAAETDAPQMLLAVARSRTDLDGALRALLLGLLLAGASVAGGAVIAVRYSVLKGLAPMDELAAAVASLDPAELPDRLDLAPSPREVQPVHARLDELLKSLCESMERERRFTGLASHELRTPIAELRALIDVRLRWPQSVDACLGSLREARGITEHMERLVQIMLMLARAERAPSDAKAERLDLSRTLAAILPRHANAAESKSIMFRAELSERAACLGDSASLNLILDNVLSNAVEYTPPSGEVIVSLRKIERAECAEFEVTNGPTDLTIEDVPRLSEPFWRKDTSRSAPRGADHHLGLGLPLVAAIVRRMDGNIEFDVCFDGMLRVRVRFPSVQAEAHTPVALHRTVEAAQATETNAMLEPRN